MIFHKELDDCYGLRWTIEVDWRTIKVTMAMDVLRCQSPEMVRKEISVHLLAYNLVRWAMATAAKLADVLPAHSASQAPSASCRRSSMNCGAA